MIEIIKASPEHIPMITSIAKKTWDRTYQNILTTDQISYMLDMMYYTNTLTRQILDLNHSFLLIRNTKSKSYQGFASLEFNYAKTDKTKLHKLYVLPNTQGLGLGRKLMEEVFILAVGHDNKSVSLNMNRYNKSLGFYKRMGFEIIGEEDIDIGNGYLMEDYIFEKKLTNI